MEKWIFPQQRYSVSKILLITVVYFLAAKISLLLTLTPGSYATAIWPAAGVALSAMLWFGYSIWPGIFLGAFLAFISSHLPHPETLSVYLGSMLIALSACLEAFIGTYCLRKFAKTIKFTKNTYSLFIFVLFSAGFAALINAFFGPLILVSFALVPAHAFWRDSLTWWLGDFAGIITTTSLIMAWYSQRPITISLKKILEGILSIALLILISYAVIIMGYPLHFLLILIAIWCGVSFDIRFSTLMGVTLSIIITYSIINHYNLFFGTWQPVSLSLAQLFISVFFITLLTITSVLYERDKAFSKIAKINKRLHKHTDKLEQLLSLVKSTLESTADGIIVINNQGHAIDYNLQFLKLWHITHDVINSNSEKTMFDFAMAQLQEPQHFYDIIKHLKDNPEIITLDEINFLDGRIYERYSQPQRIGDKIVGRVWSFRDITRRKNMENQLSHQATHDKLTNLPNKALLQDQITQAINYAKNAKLQVAILYLDLDNFKRFKDNLESSRGETILLTFIERLTPKIRKNDTLAHLGNDVFVILLTALDNDKVINETASKIMKVFEKPFFTGVYDVHITCSIGITLYPDHGDTPEILLKNADSAMYRAKELGGNNIQIFTSDIRKEADQRLMLENSLYSAYLYNDLALSYQPIISYKTKKIVGAEVLLVWKHPTLGVIPPIKFIKLAEIIGLIGPIGEWVLRTACKQNKMWKNQGISTRISVNLSAKQLDQANLVDTIKKIINETKISSENLELELTETMLISYDESILCVIDGLKKLGLNLVLDDFGTGYSGLDYIRRFPINKIKIDKSFIQSFDTNPNSIPIMKAMVEMARNLKVKILAEGVETKDQFDLMYELGCDEVQGYYLSKAITALEYEQLLIDNRDFFKI